MFHIDQDTYLVGYEAMGGIGGEQIGGGGGDGSRSKLPEFAGEQPTRAQIEAWGRRAMPKFTDDQQAVLRGEVPSTLESQTSVFDIDMLPTLPNDANADKIAARETQLAQIKHENDRKTRLRDKKIKEISNAVALLLQSAGVGRRGHRGRQVGRHELQPRGHPH